MIKKSSLPPGHMSIALKASLWNTFRVFKHRLSLALISIAVISFSAWLYVANSIHEVFEFIKLSLLLIVIVGFLIFLFSIPNLRIRRKYLKYKIRRQQLLKRYFPDPRDHQKINRVVDVYQQHLRAIDEELQAEFGLGV